MSCAGQITVTRIRRLALCDLTGFDTANVIVKNMADYC